MFSEKEQRRGKKKNQMRRCTPKINSAAKKCDRFTFTSRAYIQLVIPICLPGENSGDVDQHTGRRIARMLIRDSEWEQNQRTGATMHY